jgi:hypothetical protein
LIALVAPEAKIIPVRVLDQNGLGNTWVLAEALAYAVDPDGNPNTQDGADVINLSLSTLRETRLLRSALAKVCDDVPEPGEEDFPAIGNPNLVIVAAAGNNQSTTREYPAAENIKGLISVGASTAQDALASFSNMGSWVRVAAPGEAILSTVPNSLYGTWNGTSMAAPFVAGEAALLRAAFPNVRNDKIVQHIERNSVSINATPDVRIDIGAALTTQPEVEPSPSPTPTVSPTPTPSPTPAPSPTTNPIDDAQTFVRYQYLDFLNREPDPGGWAYWTNEITSCPAGDAVCVSSRRIGVSAAFFIEQEFQQTGNFVYRAYKGSLGRQPTFIEFMADRPQITVGPNLEASKQAFLDAWVQRTEFLQKYPPSLDGATFVDALLQTVLLNSGVDLNPQKQILMTEWNSSGSRARVLRMVFDDASFGQAEYNPSFVLMEYFGYLRRDPDQGGYDFWLNVLNNREPNNYRGMVCAFLTSAEYQQRFGLLVTRTDFECAAAVRP